MQEFFFIFFFWVEQPLNLRFHLLHVKAFPENISFSKNAIFRNPTLIGSLHSLEQLARGHYPLGLGSQISMTTINVHLWVKHGVHITHLNSEDCYSQEPSPALHGQSSLSQPWSQWPQYNESSIGVTFTILNRYLQVISSPALSN